MGTGERRIRQKRCVRSSILFGSIRSSIFVVVRETPRFAMSHGCTRMDRSEPYAKRKGQGYNDPKSLLFNDTLTTAPLWISLSGFGTSPVTEACDGDSDDHEQRENDE